MMTTDLYDPLLLRPIAKDILWGGTLLKTKYHKESDTERIAESWELTHRPDESNEIAAGTFAGKTLAQYIREMGNTVVSPCYNGENFPLLIKFIDAAQPLSVQVHPDDIYAAKNEHDSGKTEMWYVVDALPGAQIVYGWKDGVSPEQWKKSLSDGTLMDCLRVIPVRRGDTFFIPPGQVHAIGAGILIAEIQQNSNLTYRVYDYNRRQPDGSLRPLHTEKAMDVAVRYTDRDIHAMRYLHGNSDTRILADCRYFITRKLSAADYPCRCIADTSFLSLLCVAGVGQIQVQQKSFPVRAGDSYFIPCGCPECVLSGDMTVLLSAPNTNA